MAETPKEIYGTQRWMSVNYFMNMLNYIIRNLLRVLFYIAAYVMLKLSLLLENLSEKCKTIENANDLAVQFVENNGDGYSSNNHTTITEGLEEINNDIPDTLDESLYIECDDCNDCSFDFNNESGRLEEKDKVVNITVNESLHIKCYDNSFDNYNELEKFTEQIEVYNNVNESLHKKCNGYSLDQNNEHEIIEKNDVSTNIVNESLHKNDNSINNNKEHEELTEKNIESNTSNNSLCVEENNQTEKTIDEKICFEENDEKINNQKFTEIINEKIKIKLNVEDEEKITPKCQVPGNKVNQKINIAKSERKATVGIHAIDLITKTLKENIEKPKLKFETKLNIDRMSVISTTKENHFEEKESMPLNKIDKKMPLVKQCHEKNDCSELAHKNTFYKSIPNFKDGSNEKRKYINRNTKMHRDSWENSDCFENRRPISNNEKLFNVSEVNKDIFSLPQEISLAHCVTEDLQSRGISNDFKLKYKQLGVLMDQNLKVGDVGEIVHNNKYIFYLVVKKKSGFGPSKSNLETAFHNLLLKMKTYKLTKLAIPKSGLDTFDVLEAKEMISKIFLGSNIEIFICTTTINQYRPMLSKINTTPKKLWEMEPQTDIIMFINMEEMYLDNWKDEIIDNVNNRYPFKDKLLNDIHIKPMAPGDVLRYKVNGEFLICVFIRPINQNPSYYTCLEKAFKMMKLLMPGYRYLGIHQGPVNCLGTLDNKSYCLLLLQIVFTNSDGEIWICGDTDVHKKYQLNQYKKTVRNAIELNNKKGYSKTIPVNKRKHYNTNNINNTNDSVKNNLKNNSDVDVITSVRPETICSGNNNSNEESWDF